MSAYAVYAIESFLALVLAVAAWSKVYDARRLKDALRLGGVSEGLLPAAAAVVPSVELLVAAGLVVGTGRSVTLCLFVASGLFCVFTAWIVYMLSRGLRPTCGCFGVASERLSRVSVIRNSVLLVLSVTAASMQSQAGALLSFSLWSVIIVTSGLAVVALALAAYLTVPSLILSNSRIAEVRK